MYSSRECLFDEKKKVQQNYNQTKYHKDFQNRPKFHYPINRSAIIIMHCLYSSCHSNA